MERRKVINSTKKYSELSFEDEESMITSVKIIRSEYFKKAIKSGICITAILAVAISYLFYGFLPNIANDSIVVVSTKGVFSLDLTLNWALFSTSIFLVIYLIKITYMKFTPSLISYIKNETNYIGFEFRKKFESIFLFFILNIISIALLFYLDLNRVQFDNTPMSQLMQTIIWIYLFISLILPIVWIFINDRFIIKIKDNFYILCDLRYNIRKRKSHDPNLLGILLTSNKLCSKFSKSGKDMHDEISQYRWLRRNDTSVISPYLHFQEFSIPFNFQKQFLNIVMALSDWQNKYDHNLDTLNYYFSTSFPYHKYKIKKYQKDNREDQLLFFKFSRF